MLAGILYKFANRESKLYHMPYQAACRTALLLQGYMEDEDGLWRDRQGNVAEILPLEQYDEEDVQ